MKRSAFNNMLEDMRSGEYPKGKSFLCRHGSDGNIYWCCLGILSEQHRQATPQGEWSSRVPPNVTTPKEKGVKFYLEDAYDLPFAVQEWAGCSSSRGEIFRIDYSLLPGHVLGSLRKHEIKDGNSYTFDTINDQSGLSFEDMADLFEAHADQIVTSED